MFPLGKGQWEKSKNIMLPGEVGWYDYGSHTIGITFIIRMNFELIVVPPTIMRIDCFLPPYDVIYDLTISELINTYG
jgi:hypothetical protein